jgi:hypothetical protein
MAKYGYGVRAEVNETVRALAEEYEEDSAEYQRRAFKLRASALLEHRRLRELTLFGIRAGKRRHRDRIKALLHRAEIMKLVPPKTEKGPPGIPGSKEARKGTSELSVEAKAKQRSRRDAGKKAVRLAWTAIRLGLARLADAGEVSLNNALVRLRVMSLEALDSPEVENGFLDHVPEVRTVGDVIPIAQRTRSKAEAGGASSLRAGVAEDSGHGGFRGPHAPLLPGDRRRGCRGR